MTQGSQGRVHQTKVKVRHALWTLGPGATGPLHWQPAQTELPPGPLAASRQGSSQPSAVHLTPRPHPGVVGKGTKPALRVPVTLDLITRPLASVQTRPRPRWPALS